MIEQVKDKLIFKTSFHQTCTDVSLLYISFSNTVTSLFLPGFKAVYGGRVPNFEEKDAGSGKMCSTILGLMKIDWRPKDSLDMLFGSLKR